MLTPITTALFAAAGMLSSDGRCKTLSAAADGFGRGEACVTLALRLHGSGAEAELAGQALVAADDGHGLLLLKGTAVGQDGRSSSLTAPNGPAQQATIAATLVEAHLQGQARMARSLCHVTCRGQRSVVHRQICPVCCLALCDWACVLCGPNLTAVLISMSMRMCTAQEVGSLQLHGTGTPLGDPVEVGAAMAVLRAPAGKSRTGSEPTDGHRRTLTLTACKPALGHTEPAAGAVGLVHALAALEHMHRQPLLHLRQVCGPIISYAA